MNQPETDLSLFLLVQPRAFAYYVLNPKDLQRQTRDARCTLFCKFRTLVKVE